VSAAAPCSLACWRVAPRPRQAGVERQRRASTAAVNELAAAGAWKAHDAYQRTLERLLRDLCVEAT
jgi:hypothetical protein